jgi:phosphatidate phosphatase PAH1
MRNLLLTITASLVCGCVQIPPADIPSPTLSQSAAVITDIDGTLTPRDIDVSEPRPSAATALNALANKGYKIVYLTTRIPLFQPGLKDWLQQNGFPPGSLHVAQTANERNSPDKFKAQILTAYTGAGWRLAYAYGDSSTDFAAYAEAHISKDNVFALRRRGQSTCQDGVYQSCLAGWEEHLPYINKEVPVAK